jgi:hypothetical protein
MSAADDLANYDLAVEEGMGFAVEPLESCPHLDMVGFSFFSPPTFSLPGQGCVEAD